MADRNFSEKQLSLEKGVVHLFMKVAIGSSGAPTISAANSRGISSIARNSTGDYTVTLADKYQKLLAFNCVFLDASGLPDAPLIGLDNSTDVTASTPVVRFVCCSSAGTAADPGSGETMYAHFVLSNSTAY